LKSYLTAVEGKCDLMVLRVDPYGTWFEAANIGEFQIKNFTLQGTVYIDYVGELTETATDTKVGFIENGHLYLSIQGASSGGGEPYTLPIASETVLGGIKIGSTLEIDAGGVLDVGDGTFIKNQKLAAQIANEWISGSIYAGDELTLAGSNSNVFGGFRITESIVDEDLPVDNPYYYVGMYFNLIGLSITYGRDPDTWEPLEGYTLKNVDIGEVVTFAEAAVMGFIFPEDISESFLLQWLQTNIAQGRLPSQYQYLTLSELQSILGNEYLGPNLLNLRGAGLNNILGSFNVNIAKSILSSVFGSDNVAIGASNNTVNSKRQAIINSYQCSILNADYSIILNSDNTCSIGVNGPNTYYSARLGIFNSQSSSIVAGSSIGIYDSNSINIYPSDETYASYLLHVAASSGLTLIELRHSFIAGAQGNTLQKSNHASIIGSYNVAAFNLSASAIFASSAIYLNDINSGNLENSAIIASTSIFVRSGAELSFTLIAGGYNVIVEGTIEWATSIISGTNHTLGNTLNLTRDDLGAYNSGNLVIGAGHNLEAINFSLISGLDNIVRRASSSAIMCSYSTMENVSFSIVACENSNYSNIIDSVLCGASTTFRNDNMNGVANYGGNLILGDSHTILNSSKVTTFGRQHIIQSSNNVICSENHNQIEGSEYISVIGQANIITPNVSSTTLLGNHLISGYSNQYIFGKYNENFADSILEIGYGDEVNNIITRKNIFRLNTTGDVELNTVVMKILTDHPESLTGKLYNLDGILYWQGGPVGGNVTISTSAPSSPPGQFDTVWYVVDA
jgi:hypothetical protein